MLVSNINEAKANLSQLIKRALAGDEIIIARANEPLVKLTPITQDVSPRIGGFWSGKVQYLVPWEEMDQEVAELFAASEISPREGA